MVSEASGRATFTRAEAEVLRVLADGPAEMAATTRVFTKQPALGGAPFEIRQVDRRTTQRLVRAGWARVDLGGMVHLTDKAKEAQQ